MTTAKPGPTGADTCVFCTKFSETNDDHNLIVKRYKHCIAILNAYPYNTGHMLILPSVHKANLSDLSPEVRAEMMEITTICVEAVKKGLKAEGANVGINLGSVSGGGVPSHLHIHIVPRWPGDTNFLATIGETKTVCTSFEDVLTVLRAQLADK